jgi:hypothetical protein
MLDRSEKVAMAKSNIFLDTDVILNWLTKEVDQNTGFKLWKCPYEIMKFVEFDSIALGIVQSMPEESILVSRDGAFRELSTKCGIKAETPERYMETHFPKVFELIKIELY